MASRIQREDTAFSHDSSRQRRPRATAKKHLMWVRSLPCLVTGWRWDVQAAHIRYADPTFGKRGTGMAEKPDDRWVVPLSREMHLDGQNAQHRDNEMRWWKRHGIDPCKIASALWGCSGNDEEGELIIRQARIRSWLDQIQ